MINDDVIDISASALTGDLAHDPAAPALPGGWPEQGPADDASLPWDRNVPSTPHTVVFAASATDVVEAVVSAAAQGLKVAVRSTGHGATPLGVVPRETSHGDWCQAAAVWAAGFGCGQAVFSL